jgi:GAF domain-containing protein
VNESGIILANLHHSIAETERQTHMLNDLAQALDECADRAAVFATVQARLRDLVPYAAMVIYRLRGERLAPEFLDGEDYRLFASLEIPLGMGLSGWVAENGKSIVNGNPSVEPGYLNDPTKFSTLRSALAVPLEARGGTWGVLSLYHHNHDAFTRDHLNLLLSLGSQLMRAIVKLPRLQTAGDRK